MSSIMSETSVCHLRIRRSAWEPTLRRLLPHGDKYAAGSIRREGAMGDLMLLVDELEIPAVIPSGLQRPPLDDWFVMVVSEDASPDINAIIADLQPRPTQTLVVLVLERSHPDRCRLMRIEQGQVMPLHACEIIGSGMLSLRTTTDRHPLDERRSSRTRGALGEDLHDRLRESTVTVIGTGRNGSQICFLLAGLGIGRLRLIDADVLQPENLDAMPGLTVNDIGLSKAESLAVRLIAFRPDLSVSLIANQTLTPHLDIGTLVRRELLDNTSLYADIRLLLPGMCVSCVGGLADPEAAFYELNAPDGSLQRGEPVAWSQQRSGSLVHLNTMACSMGIELWLRLLRGEIGAWWQRITWETNSPLQMTGTALAEDPACGLC